MIKQILIVDDDQEMLMALKEGLEKYRETFTVLTAGDGLAAVDILAKHPVSLVVADLKMPRMDGFSLLTVVMERYPDIPVVIMTGFSTPKMERMARLGGAIGYITKPFMFDELARKILLTLGRQAEGGTLHGVSSGMFLQLIEMEQKTCTIRLVDNVSGQQGVLFFRAGRLMEARVNGRQGLEAAYEIFAWDDVTLTIQNECAQREVKIEDDLQAILLEAMRMKDESLSMAAAASTNIETAAQPSADDAVGANSDADDLERIRTKLLATIGTRSGATEVYRDAGWDPLLPQIDRLGTLFEAGEFRIGYFDRDDDNDHVLLPTRPAIVVDVSPKSPRDRIVRVLIN